MSEYHPAKLTQRESKEVATLEVLFFFVLPIALLYFGIVPIAGRIPILLIVSVLIYGVIRKEGWTKKDLGLATTATRKGIYMYLGATVIALGAIIFLADVLQMEHFTAWWTHPHFLFLFLLVSFAQEFAFRGFLFPVLKRIFPDIFTVIVVNALLFALMHAIYPFPVVGLPIAFVGGLFFALLYHKYPHLVLLSLSHAVLNFAAVYYGFFTI